MTDLRRGSRTRLTLDKLAVQRAAEGRGLHAAGDPAAVRRAGADSAALRPRARCASCRVAPAPVGADRLTSAASSRRAARLFPQEAPNDPRERRRRPAGCARRCSSSRRRGCSSPPALDLRANSHDQVEDSLARRLRRSRRAAGRGLSIRRLTATLTRGPFTLDVGKQFIRWGKTDIVTPTDRFAPRDFLNVVDTEFLAVSAAFAASCRSASAHVRGRLGAAVHAEPHSAARISDGRRCRADVAAVRDRRRRRVVPGRLAGRRSLEPHRRCGSSTRCRSSTASTICRTSRSAPGVGPAGSIVVDAAIRRCASYGGDVAMPTRWFTVKGEAAYFDLGARRRPTTTCSTSSSSSGRAASGCSSAATPAKW